ncbi:Sua5/YciO/YrdC/YwlC family protein [Mycoplasma corogypsi]|uniref:Sua5/YciO/YrdC/YwlC family protein n=1 Tax=Mycoplasma corogypsi TaxID=2106 RepID=UPI00387380AC
MNNKYKDIIICTTDTVCGIGGPINEQTLELIYELKNRPKNKKIMILVGSLKQAQSFKQWNEEADKLAKKVWPGANSIVVNDQGFRMPNQAKLLEYLVNNGPIYMTSANKSGCEPINISQAKEVFPEVSKIYDFGKVSGVASTIYNLDTREIIKR